MTANRGSGRPIGKRVIAALTILEEIGPAPYYAVMLRMDGVVRQNAHKYCRRAVEYGLASTDRTGSPHTFAALPGWRDRLNGPRPKKAEAPISYRRGPASVWELGSQA